jgi:hypothetical protein
MGVVMVEKCLFGRSDNELNRRRKGLRTLQVLYGEKAGSRKRHCMRALLNEILLGVIIAVILRYGVIIQTIALSIKSGYLASPNRR